MRRSAIVLAILAIAGCGGGELSREQAEQIAHDRLDNDGMTRVGMPSERAWADVKYVRDGGGYRLFWPGPDGETGTADDMSLVNSQFVSEMDR